METESLLDCISKSSTNIYITSRWANGSTGAIMDVENNCIFRFIDYLPVGDSCRAVHLTDEDKLSCPIIACGIIAFWIKYRKQLGTKNLFEKYYSIKLNQYKTAHEQDDDAWTRDLEKEFITQHCTKQEKRLIEQSVPLFQYLPETDIQKIKSISTQYLSFARFKRKELIVRSYPQDRRIQDTFLAAYSHGGAKLCVDWVRREYNLPHNRPDANAGIQGTYPLSGPWKSFHEVEVPEIVQEEYDDFDDGVLVYSNGGLMDEIHQVLERCNSIEDRRRYISTLLQPFKEFAGAFYANGIICGREKSIKQHKVDQEHWKTVPDNATDQRTGEPLNPKEQIEACEWFINREQNEIEYLKFVESQFFSLAQRGIKKRFEKDDNHAMLISLGEWYRLMIRFSRSLAALALTYGIRLMDIQEQCGIYINWTYDIPDYVDYKFISSFNQAETLLASIQPTKKIDESSNLNESEYEKILTIIFNGYTSLENLPPQDSGSDEVSLRNYIVTTLQTFGYHATAETYNRKGKTDICIKSDNMIDNALIAECKIWHGEKQFSEAIDQLFTRYLTWRDADAALIIFVENKDFTNTVLKAKSAIEKHHLFERFQIAHINKENVFACGLQHIHDSKRIINLEVMFFHFPKQAIS